jgi:uncharacterized protein (DUF305 family)
MFVHRLRMPARLLPGAFTLAATLALSACGGSAGAPAAADPPAAATTVADERPEFNDADVTFAQRMIPHHRDALAMAALAADRASSAEVKALAKAILGAQNPEIDTMTEWLRAWGKDVPADEHLDHAGMDMPGMDMAGTDLTALTAAKGTRFDRLFVTLMTKHHQGAVADAKAERKAGRNPDALALAAAIAKAQTAEIARMKKLA